MACYRPLHGYRDKGGSIVFSARKGADIEVTVPCGQCIGCRVARSRMWALRCVHESKLWDRNCFVTLTYDDKHLPPFASLRYSDVQLFHKKLRKAVGPFRFFLAGEYGEVLGRPHYHACYFGFFPPDAKRLRSLSSERFPGYSSDLMVRLWGHGHVHIGEMTYASAAYCSGYIFKKVGGLQGADKYKRVDSDGVWQPIDPEFARMSLKPGIGADWYRRYVEDFHGRDYCVHDGKQFPVPKYYDRLLERCNETRISELREDRELRALPFRPDNVPSRLAVKAEVAEAKLRHSDKRHAK